MLDIEKQFIEGAALALFVQAWADREENTCAECGDDLDAEQHLAGDPISCRSCGCRHFSIGLGGTAVGCECPCHEEEQHQFAPRGRFSGVELMDVAPETPDYARLEAAKLLGKLESANGCSFAVIVWNAARADCGTASLGDCPEHGYRCPIDESNFGHYIAMQALGHGVSWFDDHERFEVPLRWPERATSPGDGTFIIPHIEFELE